MRMVLCLFSHLVVTLLMGIQGQNPETVTFLFGTPDGAFVGNSPVRNGQTDATASRGTLWERLSWVVLTCPPDYFNPSGLI